MAFLPSANSSEAPCKNTEYRFLGRFSPWPTSLLASAGRLRMACDHFVPAVTCRAHADKRAARRFAFAFALRTASVRMPQEQQEQQWYAIRAKALKQRPAVGGEIGEFDSTLVWSRNWDNV